MGDKTITLNFDYPVSTNRLWRSIRGRQVLSEAARAWKTQCAWKARAAGLPLIAGPVAVSITLHPRLTAKGRASQCRLDVDGPIKLTLDALQGIAYSDDKQVVRIIAEIGPPKPDGGLSVDVMGVTGYDG